MSAKPTLKSITSDDLEEYAMDEDSTPRQLAVTKLLKSKVMVGKLFDWKEGPEMFRYIIKHIKKYPVFKYIYNAYPGGDGTLVIFSKVKLPKAESVEE